VVSTTSLVPPMKLPERVALKRGPSMTPSRAPLTCAVNYQGAGQLLVQARQRVHGGGGSDVAQTIAPRYTATTTATRAVAGPRTWGESPTMLPGQGGAGSADVPRSPTSRSHGCRAGAVVGANEGSGAGQGQGRIVLLVDPHREPNEGLDGPLALRLPV